MIPNVLSGLLVAGAIGSFTLLWSVSHSLVRISDRLDNLALKVGTLESSLSTFARDAVALERRLSLLESSICEKR